MATVKYLLQGSSGNLPIYLRLSAGRGITPKRKTYLNIDLKDWSKARNFPKANSANNKNLITELKKLESYVLSQLNFAVKNELTINGGWLQKQINAYFGKSTNNTSDYITDFGSLYLKNLKYKTNQKTNAVGVSSATEKKYKTIVAKLKSYDEHYKVKTRIVDINLDWRIKFIKFLEDEQKLSRNTIGRYLKFVKSICLEAEKLGYKVSGQLKNFQGFSVEACKIILNFEELEQIESTNFLDENYKIASEWLIIGCYTGQRVSDLLRMNKGMIQTIKGYKFIVLTQQKTGNIVQIPLHKKVKEILEKRRGEFPPIFAKNIDSNKALFNRYLKRVAKIAGINKMEKGSVYDKKLKRNVRGIYPKYDLISSHICRRSFASNHYATELYPTPLLMNITSHSTEKMFLTYIGKKPLDYGLQLAKIWQDLEEKEAKNDMKSRIIKMNQKHA